MQVIEIVAIAAIGFVGWTVLSAQVAPVSTVEGKQPIHYKPDHLAGWKGDTDGRGTLTLSDESGVRARYVIDDNGVLVEDPTQESNTGLTATFQPDRYLGYWDTDIGAFAAVDSQFRLGIRYSPVRLGWDTVAPDIVASESAIGLGVSLFPPVKSDWRHFGAGIWYLHDLDSGDNRFSFGLSTSIR